MAITKYITLDSLRFFYKQLRGSNNFLATTKLYGTIKLGGDMPKNLRPLQATDQGNAYIELFPKQGDNIPDIGSPTQPIYIHQGEFTAVTASIGSGATTDTSAQAIYMKDGSLTPITKTIGSATQPIYMKDGVFTASTQNLGSGSTAGTTAQAIYMLNGALKAIETTIGKKSQPVYLNKGKFEACDDMGVVIKQIQDELAALIDSSVKNIKFNQNFNRIEVTTEKSTTAADGSVTKTDEVYITAALTKLEKPSKPTIATISYTLVSGSASVAIKNTFKSAVSIQYRIKTNGTTTWGAWTNLSSSVASGSSTNLSIASGYANTQNNTVVKKDVEVKAIFNGEESDINSYIITINPKVAAPADISVVRSINDNNSYGTKLEVKVSPSATTGATNKYSLDGGTSWTTFTESNTVVFTETTTESEKETHTLNVKVKAEKSNYTNSDVKTNTTTYTIGQEKAYCGSNTISTLAGMSKAEILKLATKQSAANLSAGSYTITASSGNYMWYCCTTKHSDINSIVVMSAANPAPFGMNYMGQIGAWHCYRSTNSLLGTANFYHK